MEKLTLLLSLTDKLSGPLKGVDQRLQSFARRSENAFKRIAVGGAALWGVGLGIKAALQPAIEMDRALGEVKSLGVAEKGLHKLRAASLDFTMAYGGSAAEFVRSSYDIQSAIAGLTDNELSRFTTASGVLAKGTKSSSQTVTAYMGTLYGIFRQQADAMGKSAWVDQVAGQTATAVQMFKTTGDQMSGAFSSLGASATSAGIEAAEQFAILGQLQSTMSGSEAGTKYKAFLGGIGKAQKTLGLKFTNDDGSMKGVTDIMRLIEGKFGDLSKVADSDLLQKAFGTKEAVDMVKLLSKDINGLEKNIASLGNVKGMDKATEMANAMADPWEKSLAVINAMRIEIGTQLLPVLYPFIDNAVAGGREFVKWLQLYPNLTRAIGLMAAALLVLAASGAIVNVMLGTFKFVSAGLRPLLTALIWLFRLDALWKMTAAGATKVYEIALRSMRAGMLAASIAGRGMAVSMLLASWPIVLIGVAIAAVIALIWKFQEPLKAFFGGFIQGFADAWGSLSKGSPLFSALGSAVSVLWNGVKTLFGWLSDLFTPISLTKDEFDGVSQAGSAFGRIVANAVSFILGPLEATFGLLGFIWDALVIIGKGWADIWNSIDCDKPLESLKNVATGILNIFDNLWGLVKSSFAGTYNWVIGKLNMIPGVSIDVKEIAAPDALSAGNGAAGQGAPLLTGGQVQSVGPGGISQQIQNSSERRTQVDQSNRVYNIKVENASPQNMGEWMETHAY